MIHQLSMTIIIMILLVYFPILLLALYTIAQHLLHKILNLPPTPFPILPFIGHMYLLKNPKLPMHLALSKVSSRHGPVVFLRLGSQSVLLVSSQSAAQECFTKNDSVFANRPNHLTGKHFGNNFTSITWASYGNRWRQLRRMASLELLCLSKIHMLSSFRAAETRTMIKNMVKCHLSNKTVDVKSLLAEYSYSVAARMITGKEGTESSKDADEFQELTAEMSRLKKEAEVIDFLPFMGWFKDVEMKMSLVQRRRDEFIQKLMDEHRLKMRNYGSAIEEDGDKKLILHVLLDLQDEEPKFFTDQTIRNLILVLIQAPFNTVSSTLEGALSLLLENPNVLTKVRADIDDHVGKERLLTEDDLLQLPYLRCIVSETLRMRPPAPMLSPRLSSENCTLSGFHVPRGTMLLVNTWDIHNCTGTWEDPDKFMPERFLQNNYGFGFLPFGWGRRGCPGENLGMNVVGMALGCLIQCFQWEKIDDLEGVEMPMLSANFIPRPFVVNLL